MGEPPPPSPPGAPILLVLLSLAGSNASGEAGKESKAIFTEPEKVSNWSVSHNSGLHPLIVAVYGEYDFYLPQKRLHSLKHKGVAFLYHPSACPFLHRRLGLLARACLPHRILTPHGGPPREQPLVLVAWRASLPITEADLARAVSWLKRRASRSGWGGKSKRNRSDRHWLKRAVGKGVCPLHRVQVLQKLFRRREHGLHPSVRQRRALNWPKQLFGRIRDLAAPVPSQGKVVPPTTLALPPEKKKLLEPSKAYRGVHLTPTGLQPSLPTLPTEETGVARTAGGCQCPGGETGQAQGHSGKALQAKARVPTPRTEEAAWAASALTFLLVVLTLAVLYTRLHQKCRRGRSLYWTVSSEEDHDTVAAVIKRRLLSTQVRRKKRPRQQQRRELLPSTSSDSSD